MLLFAGGDLRLVEVDGDFLTSSRVYYLESTVESFSVTESTVPSV
ncbi:hypothetical protein HMPREF9241_00652 [Schaalia turicensis ACS-279-V-Col4]|uniref:Uncharacterized protein n=1 Tax=Schaalia turicensis ACS-279-V-Col4 TaxID=883077 RepID=K0YU97_9ACTO|nr:hypothetical protein HMPREF9241_00652 [Schaalia turicensis ACS-279-V-Col4]